MPKYEVKFFSKDGWLIKRFDVYAAVHKHAVERGKKKFKEEMGKEHDGRVVAEVEDW